MSIGKRPIYAGLPIFLEGNCQVAGIYQDRMLKITLFGPLELAFLILMANPAYDARHLMVY
jgi:hypothetical protein